MKNSDYITILAPMVSKLNLSGNNLIVFALIHGFCKDGEHEFKGSIDYIHKWTNLSKPTIIATLKLLTECGYINKNESIVNNVKFCHYTTNYDSILNSGKVSLPLVNKFNGGGKETLPNIDNNNDNDKSLSYTKEKEDNKLSSKKKFNFLQALIDLGITEQIAKDWLIVRKDKKATNTQTAFNRIANEIKQCAITPNECITIAVERSWSGFKAEWLDNLFNKKTYSQIKESINIDNEQETSNNNLFINGQEYR